MVHVHSLCMLARPYWGLLCQVPSLDLALAPPIPVRDLLPNKHSLHIPFRKLSMKRSHLTEPFLLCVRFASNVQINCNQGVLEIFNHT